MGCCTSKAFEEGESIEFSSPLLDNLRNTVETNAESYDAKGMTHKVLDILDNYLRSRFLDKLISTINLPEGGYLVAEHKLPESVSRYLDENTRALCEKQKGMVDCYQLLSNVILSSRFVPYPCEDTEKRYICQQFSTSKDYKSFLYGLSTLALNRDNVCEYSATYQFGEDSIAISPLESLILDSIPHILDKEPTAGEWEDFCRRNGLDANQSVKLPALQPDITIKLPVTENKQVSNLEGENSEPVMVEVEETKPEEKAEEKKAEEEKPVEVEEPVKEEEEPEEEKAEEEKPEEEKVEEEEHEEEKVEEKTEEKAETTPEEPVTVQEEKPEENPETKPEGPVKVEETEEKAEEEKTEEKAEEEKTEEKKAEEEKPEEKKAEEEKTEEEKAEEEKPEEKVEEEEPEEKKAEEEKPEEKVEEEKPEEKKQE